MSMLPDPTLLSLLTLVGWSWSGVTYWLMFSHQGRTIMSKAWTIIPAAILLFLSLWHVTSEMGKLSAMAGGMTPLDGQFAYGVATVTAFAERLGPDGRIAYAVFQLGADALAPPAFLCFLMSVYRSTVRSMRIQFMLTALAFTYFTSVLIANTFMPVIMQNYPDTESGLLPLLYSVIPMLDLVKYVTHGIAWLIIFSAWAWQLADYFRRARTTTAH
ncbi:hypothetical protein BN1012_Phect2354 [Candidatus Phaeomarinobacter ectocarpi]|uniref:Uncharacterized protein n=1 Tax=Candidatus Phaeomarinibacter ectocarpi TaxID=1458461 RepID=X5MDY4_9HYPH|nr:hypothetical protein [Candidatus Phaeomarinobacter ectocarpi]CDO60567.1 hypothetical protein BN1012_Phect2354 [Candidatus Phaeomarinobacter ectocarpi]